MEAKADEMLLFWIQLMKKFEENNGPRNKKIGNGLLQPNPN
jgi:hypothetical protein